MFESSQYFPGSCGHNFVGSKVEIILIIKYLTNDCIFVHGDVNMWTKVIHKSHEDWSPMNNYDFWLWYIECLHAKIPIIPFKICFTCKWKNKQMTPVFSGLVEFYHAGLTTYGICNVYDILAVSPECLADFLTSLKHWISVNNHLFTWMKKSKRAKQLCKNKHNNQKSKSCTLDLN